MDDIIIPIIKLKAWAVKAYGNAIGNQNTDHQAESLACKSLWQRHRKLKHRSSG